MWAQQILENHPPTSTWGQDQMERWGQNYPVKSVTCDRCGLPTPKSETVDTVRGSTVCASCQNDWYWQCQACDGWNRDGTSCGNGCCDPGCDCADCQDDNPSGLIYNYGYKPTPVFRGTGPLFLGPEIEVEAPRDGIGECAEIATRYLGSLGYLKWDASIDNGFEIVTHPMSYEWAMVNFPWQMLLQLSEYGCFVTGDTGLHVHVSRSGLASTCHIYRWMKFIYRNERQVKVMARRSSDNWAAFTTDDRRLVKDYAKGARGERCRAINTSNDDTFELRVFASSLDPRTVKAALGFVDASVEYTRTLTVAEIAKKDGWAWSTFVAWLAGRPTYAPLIRQLEELPCVC